MNNWLSELFNKDPEEILKESSRREVQGDLDLKKQDRDQFIKDDYERQIKALSDSNLAEFIAELELQGEGLPEQMNARVSELKKTVKNNRTSAENKLKKLLPEHSKIATDKFFDRIEKEAAKNISLPDYAREVIGNEKQPSNILMHLNRRKKVISKEQLESELKELNAILSDAEIRKLGRAFLVYADEKDLDLSNPQVLNESINEFLKITGREVNTDRLKEFLKVEPQD